MELHGIAASPGMGGGQVVVISERMLQFESRSTTTPGEERARLEQATEEFRVRTAAMEHKTRETLGAAEAEILSGQLMMLDDPFLSEKRETALREGLSAEGAVEQSCTAFAALFSSLEDEYMRQRAADVLDMRGRLLELLLGVKHTDLSTLPAGTVLVAEDLTPSMTVGLRRDCIAAIVTEVGGKTSHSAILARALGIPAVLSVENASGRLYDGQTVIVDGDAGLVRTDPDAGLLAQCRARQERDNAAREKLKVYREAPTMDADGNRTLVYANIGSPAEAEAAAQSGAEGIGLFRTEFLFMGRNTMPDEEEQYQAYVRAARCMGEREVIIRTLDVGGDKPIPYLEIGQEENPFLGHRAIRYCLKNPELFKIQLRALLRAGAERGNVRIMLPMITGVEEVRAARALLEECKCELAHQDIPFDRHIPVGIMVETPAAALIADLLAREVDFFSIGTNDLTQYTMAVDRGNAMVASLYNTFHPAVLRSIQRVIRAGKEVGIPVGMCGEAAADSRMLPLLLSFGLDEFSVGVASVLSVRAAIAGWHRQEADATAQRAMEEATAHEVCVRLRVAAERETPAGVSSQS